MKILALEFSSDRRSVAVLDSDHQAGILPVVAVENGPRGLQGLQLVERALAEAKLDRREIDCLAVGLGPGSYTGIRSGISIAQGWQLARDTNVLGITAVDCLAAQLAAEGCTGKINFAIDAQRMEFYLAAYQLSDGLTHMLEPLRLATRAEVEARGNAGENVAGPGLDRMFAFARSVFPDAAMLARLASRRTDFVSAEKLEPVYLRETSFVKTRTGSASHVEKHGA